MLSLLLLVTPILFLGLPSLLISKESVLWGPDWFEIQKLYSYSNVKVPNNMMVENRSQTTNL